MSPEKMIGLSFAAAAAKLYEVLGKLSLPRAIACGVVAIKKVLLFDERLAA